jgi:hypothetical protein
MSSKFVPGIKSSKAKSCHTAVDDILIAYLLHRLNFI